MPDDRKIYGWLYVAERRVEERTVLGILIAATPTTPAMLLMRISRTNATAEGETSTECSTFSGVKATACLTPMFDTSMCPSFDAVGPARQATLSTPKAAEQSKLSRARSRDASSSGSAGMCCRAP